MPHKGMPSAPPSERQIALCQAIADHAKHHAAYPTVRELGAALGHSSTRSTTELLFRCVAKGYVTRHPMKFDRNIELSDKGRALVQE